MMKLISLISLIVLSTACIKTADQVNREKRFESMSEQMKDSQGLVADLVSQMKDMQQQLDKMNGRLEEIEHRQKQVDPQNIAKMNETMNVMKTQQETESQQLLAIQNELKEQRTFLEKVTASLAAAKESAPKETKSSKKKSARGDLEEALADVKSNNYDDARTTLESLIDHEDLTPGDHNKVLHGLGRVEYYTGHPDKALVYFSKIYTKFPKASLAPSSLLFIGRSLEKMGKKDEAKEAYAKVIEDYKGSKEANEAKKEL
jgi:TolA-binding protein